MVDITGTEEVVVGLTTTGTTNCVLVEQHFFDEVVSVTVTVPASSDLDGAGFSMFWQMSLTLLP